MIEATETTETLDLQVILTAIRQAEDTISAGREKARRAKALLGRVEAIKKEIEEARSRAETIEKEVEKARAQANREVTVARDALAKARNLQPVLGKEFVARAETAVAQIEQEWAARIRDQEARLDAAREEVQTLEARLNAVRKELRALAEAPETRAFLTLHEYRQREEARRRVLREAELRRRLRALRPGVLIGGGEEALRQLAREAEEDGFDDLAAEASEAAERAARIRLAREAEAEERQRRNFVRWCNKHSTAGHVVLVLSWDEHQAVQLRPHPAASGRVWFEVVDATGVEEPPASYSDLPATSRTWRVRRWCPPAGEFTPQQVGFLQALITGIRGREANEMNAALARARERETDVGSSGDEATRAEVEATTTTTQDDLEPDPVPAREADDLEGLPARVAGRLRRAGLTTREAIREALDDEAAFLARPGIGPATLAAVRRWLREPVTRAGEADEPSSPAEVGPADPAPEGETEAAESATEAGTGEESEGTSPDVVEPEIVVVGLQMGADMPGTRLAAWRGIARTLTGTLRDLGIPRLELLVEETWNGNGPEIGLLATWDGRAGDVGRAEELLAESLEISRESANPRLIMPALNLLADIACHRGDYDEAISKFDECLALSRDLGDRFNAAIHLNNLGTVLQVLGKHQEAGTLFQESLEICHEIGDQVGEAIALSNLGKVAHETGAYRKAMVCYQEGLSIGRSVQDPWTIMACLTNLGETACALEEYEAASARLAEALRIAIEIRSMTVLVGILVNVAVLFAKEGLTDRAAMLLGLTSSHPAGEQAVRDKARRLMDEMGLASPERLPESLDAAAVEALVELESLCD